MERGEREELEKEKLEKEGPKDMEVVEQEVQKEEKEGRKEDEEKVCDKEQVIEQDKIEQVTNMTEDEARSEVRSRVRCNDWMIGRDKEAEEAAAAAAESGKAAKKKKEVRVFYDREPTAEDMDGVDEDYDIVSCFVGRESLRDGCHVYAWIEVDAKETLKRWEQMKKNKVPDEVTVEVKIEEGEGGNGEKRSGGDNDEHDGEKLDGALVASRDDSHNDKSAKACPGKIAAKWTPGFFGPVKVKDPGGDGEGVNAEVADVKMIGDHLVVLLKAGDPHNAAAWEPHLVEGVWVVICDYFCDSFLLHQAPSLGHCGSSPSRQSHQRSLSWQH